MKIAITGAAGYLGTQIVNKVIKNPKIESIIAIDRVPIKSDSPKVKAVVSDITSPKIASVLSGCYAVVHLAFIIGDSTNRPALYRINIDGSRNVFEGAQGGGAKRLIVASSIAAYGYYPDNPKVMDENSPLRGNPDNAYSDTKRLVELLLNDFEKKYPEIGVVRFRPGVILGPNTKGAFRALLKLPIFIDFKSDGPGFWSRAACVHEDDVADAFILGILGKERGAYNLAVEPFVTREQILKMTHQIPLMLPAGLIGVTGHPKAATCGRVKCRHW
jgi:UDP-glucose 4-epimerase